MLVFSQLLPLLVVYVKVLWSLQRVSWALTAETRLKFISFSMIWAQNSFLEHCIFYQTLSTWNKWFKKVTSPLVIILAIVSESRQGTERNPAEDWNQDHDRWIQRDVAQLSWWSKTSQFMNDLLQSINILFSPSNPISSSNNKCKMENRITLGRILR